MISDQLRYAVHFDYVRDRTGCNCGTICRCSTIENPTFKRFEHHAIKRILKDYDDIDGYCVERLITLNLLHHKHAFEARITGGYYGEEIRGWGHPNKDQLDEEAHEVLMLHDISKIFYLLEKEYSYIPDHIRDHEEVAVEERNIEELKEVNFQGLNKIDLSDIRVFPNIPIGIVRGMDIIDGNHRVLKYDGDVAKFIALK